MVADEMLQEREDGRRGLRRVEQRAQVEAAAPIGIGEQRVKP
jgi:hypothetical protein